MYQGTFVRTFIQGDGHCLYRAMSMALWGTEHEHEQTRARVVQHILSNWQEFEDRIENTFGQQYRDAQVYSSFMGDVSKREYGSEVEINAFCELFRKNATIFRLHDNWNKSSHLTIDKDMFLVSHFNHFPNTAAHDNIIFLFYGSQDQLESRGHYDLLHLFQGEDNGVLHVKGGLQNNYLALEDKALKSLDVDIVQSMGKSTAIPSLEKSGHVNSLNKENDKIKISEKFAGFLKRNNITYDLLSKKNPHAKDIFREGALEVFGEIKLKHVVFLRRMYSTNYLNIQGTIKAQSEHKNVDKQSDQDDIESILNRMYGKDLNKQSIVNNGEEVRKILIEFCEVRGWSVNKRNLKRSRYHWNKYVKLLSKYTEESAIVIENTEDESQNNIECITTNINLWNKVCDMDGKMQSLINEIISCHRRRGGVCTWRVHNKTYVNEDLSNKINNIEKIELKHCVFEECEYELLATFDRNQFGEIIITVTERSREHDACYDVSGHYEHYEHKRIPFDRMEDILYRNRVWMAIFGGNKEDNVKEAPMAEAYVEEGVGLPIYNDCSNIIITDKTSSDGQNTNILGEIAVDNSVDNIGIGDDSEGIGSREQSVSEQDREVDVKLIDEEENDLCYRETLDKRHEAKPWVYYKYSHFEGTLKAKTENIFDENGLNASKLKTWIRKSVLEQKRIYCRIIFKSMKLRKRRNNQCVIYATCGSSKNKKCKDYRFNVVYKEHPVIRIWSRGPLTTVHSGRPKAYQIRGRERIITKEKLKVDPAKTVQNKAVNQLNEDAVVELNMQNVSTLLTLRKIRSEAFKEDDLHENDLVDLILLGKLDSVESKSDLYIKKVSALPLQVHLYTDKQVDVLKTHKIITAYFDATGSVARNVSLSLNRRILYYALVINVNSEILPIAEMLSESQNIQSIADFFLSFKYNSLQSNKNKWPLIKRIVCDWSWAIMIGIVAAWNSMNLLQYLNFCYKICTGSILSQDHQDKITIHACCAHFMKMVSDKISKINIRDKTLKRFVMNIMANMIMCDNINDFDLIYKNFVTVLISDRNYNITNTALENLKKIIENTESEFVQILDDVDDDDGDSYENESDDIKGVTGRTKLDSPFFVRYEAEAVKITKKLEESMVQEGDNNETNNNFYCPTFFDYFQNNLIPLLPFWSGLMIKVHHKSDDSAKRFSNANVENYFQQVKHRLLKNKTHIKIGRLVKLLRDNVDITLKNIRINLAEYNKEKKCRDKSRMVQCVKRVIEQDTKETTVDNNQEPESNDVKAPDTIANTREQENSDDDVDDPNLEENWCKRKSTESYFTSPAKRTLNLSEKSNYEKSSQNINFENNTEKLLAEMKDEGSVKKIRISISKDYPHRQSLPNGLFDSPKFYTNVKTADSYVVGLFKNITPSKKLILFGEEYSSLDGNKEVMQGAIDASIAALIKLYNKESTAKLVNIETTHSLFRENSVTVASPIWTYFRNISKFETLIMPYLIRINATTNHYCLIIGDLLNKICHFYNPLPGCGDSIPQAHRKFRNFISTLQKTNHRVEGYDVNKWTYREATGAVQNDSYNCGVFVVNFVEHWLNNDVSLSNFDPLNYRNYLRTLCLRQSEDMTDICLYCGRGETKCLVWIMCENCKRWLHFKPCLRHLNISLDIVENTEFSYVCDLCNTYIKIYNGNPWDENI